MATTPVLGLRKPARTDLVSVVTDINNNMDILDQAYDDLSTVSLNIAMTIPSNVWSANAPYTYTWLDSRISQKCDIEVGFFSGAESSDLMYLAYEKVPFGIKFTASNKPTTGVPLTIKIINAEAESITSVTGDMVSTSVIPGAANADEALSVLNNNLTKLNNNMTYNVGDTFNTRSWRAVGRIVNSGKGLFCWIDMAKPIIANSFNITFDGLPNIFGIGTYTASGTISNKLISGNELQFVIDLSSTHTAGQIGIAEFNASITLT